jgi:hypothetical protein
MSNEREGRVHVHVVARGTANDRPIHLAVTREIEPIDTIIARTVARARALITDHRVALAVAELEKALVSFVPDLDAGGSMPAAVWQIEYELAALYERVGRKQGARRMARNAYQHALHAGTALARARASELLQRLLAPPPERLARGSTEMRALPRRPVTLANRRITRGRGQP